MWHEDACSPAAAAAAAGGGNVCMYVAYVLYSECHNSPSLAAVCSSNNLHMHSEWDKGGLAHLMFAFYLHFYGWVNN